MESIRKNFKGGLIPPKREWVGKRRFRYTKYFGAPLPIDIPDFEVGRTKIKNQEGDMCMAFAATSVSEQQEGVELSPSWQFAQIKKLMGDWAGYGGDPDATCKSMTKVGSIEESLAPLKLEVDHRDRVANWNNWPSTLEQSAYVHKKKSWFEIDAPWGQDKFDTICRVLFENRDKGVTAIVGTYWQPEWTFNPGGICEHYGPDRSLPHGLKIFGKKTINTKPYLMVQNSWGTSMGDGGIWYFSREVANKLLFARAFFDADPEEVKRETWSLLARLKNWLLSLLAPAPVVIPDPAPEPEPHVSRIKEWGLAVQGEEGWFEGSRSKRNNNPGNLKYTLLTRELGAIDKDVDWFCVFPSYDAGFNALCDFLTLAAQDKLKDYHDARTLSLFTRKYANPPNNNYELNVAKKVGVDVNIEIKELL